MNADLIGESVVTIFATAAVAAAAATAAAAAAAGSLYHR